MTLDNTKKSKSETTEPQNEILPPKKILNHQNPDIQILEPQTQEIEFLTTSPKFKNVCVCTTPYKTRTYSIFIDAHWKNDVGTFVLILNEKTKWKTTTWSN